MKEYPALLGRSFLAALVLGTLVDTRAADVGLFESLKNIDGVSSDADPTVDPNDIIGLPRSYSYTRTTPGPHFVGLYLDMEIDETVNGFVNEYGAHNIAAPGQTWEIDEPGFNPPFGDIYSNFGGSGPGGSLLDNSNAVPFGSENDVATAIGWNFTLLPSQTATISFLVSSVAPASGFYLSHTDDLSNLTVYFSSALSIITSGPPGVPDAGSTLVLMLAGVGALATMGFRKPR
jgi:hypothetical protein